MRTSRFGGFLLAVGGLVGVVAVVGLVIGFEPAKMPPALLNIAVYKLTFVAAAGLLAAGAVVRRYARRDEGGQREPIGANDQVTHRPAALDAGSLGPASAPRSKQATPADIHRMP